MRDENTKEKIQKQLELWLNNFFPSANFEYIMEFIDEAYVRSMEAISASNNKYLKTADGVPRFPLCHTSCWTIFLYYLSNSLGRAGGGMRSKSTI